MPVKRDFPSDQQCNGQNQQSPGIGLGHEEQRSEHHGIVPVVDAARDTAFVLQEPGLERAEEQNADHIADRVGAAEKQHNSLIEDADHVQGSENAVETEPDQENEHRGIVIRHHKIRFSRFPVVSEELLLAPGAFQTGWKETKNHFHRKYQEKHADNHRTLVRPGHQIGSAPDPEDDICDQKQEKEDGAVNQTEIMKHTDTGHFFPVFVPVHCLLPFRTVSLPSPQVLVLMMPFLFKWIRHIHNVRPGNRRGPGWYEDPPALFQRDCARAR